MLPMLNKYTMRRSTSPRNPSRSIEVRKVDTRDSAVARMERGKACWMHHQQKKQKEGSMWVPDLALGYGGGHRIGSKPQAIQANVLLTRFLGVTRKGTFCKYGRPINTRICSGSP